MQANGVLSGSIYKTCDAQPRQTDRHSPFAYDCALRKRKEWLLSANLDRVFQRIYRVRVGLIKRICWLKRTQDRPRCGSHDVALCTMRPVCTQDELADPYRMHLYKRRWAELKPISTRVISQCVRAASVRLQCAGACAVLALSRHSTLCRRLSRLSPIRSSFLRL